MRNVRCTKTAPTLRLLFAFSGQHCCDVRQLILHSVAQSLNENICTATFEELTRLERYVRLSALWSCFAPYTTKEAQHEPSLPSPDRIGCRCSNGGCCRCVRRQLYLQLHHDPRKFLIHRTEPDHNRWAFFGGSFHFVFDDIHRSVFLYGRRLYSLRFLKQRHHR